jgi:hypothetical protein
MADQKKRKTPARYELGEALDNELEDLSEGYKGASVTRLVREAVEEFIERCLDDEPAVRRRYDAARKKRLDNKDLNLSIVRNDDD